MKAKIDVKRALLSGLIILIIYQVIGNLLYMNPIVMDIFQLFENHPSSKSMDYFGGQGNWIMINSVFSILFTIAHLILFLLLYNSLPGNKIIKGLFYGLIVIVISIIPESFNLFMTINYPTLLIKVLFVNHVISYLLLGLIMTLVYNKMKALRYE